MKNPILTGTTDDNGLRLEKLSKNFGEFIAVEDVNLHIRRGEFLTILGPSGSGKTRKTGQPSHRRIWTAGCTGQQRVEFLPHSRRTGHRRAMGRIDRCEP